LRNAWASDPDQHTLELYSPGYLSLGARPAISTAPHSVTYGTAFLVETPQAANIGSVVLIAPISVTHYTDAGQRHIKLPINSRTPTTLETTAPANGYVAPPGFYMLFVVNNQGVPSEARFIGSRSMEMDSAFPRHPCARLSYRQTVNRRRSPVEPPRVLRRLFGLS
jgi:hypothetical protein